jgi:hypothetical protein
MALECIKLHADRPLRPEARKVPVPLRTIVLFAIQITCPDAIEVILVVLLSGDM